MLILVDKRNMQLRGVYPHDPEIHLDDDKVVLPDHIVNDLNRHNAILIEHDEATLPGLTSDDMQCWKKYFYYYNIEDETFYKVVNP